MNELNPEKLHRIQTSLPEFRALDTIRNRKGLSPDDNRKWSRLYGELLALFDAPLDFNAEQRKALRLPIRVRVNFTVNREQFFTMSHDLSVGGVSVNLHHNLPLSTLASMEIGLHSSRLLTLWRSKSFSVPGKVAWLSQRHNRIGFEFEDLSTSQRLIIEDHLYLQMENQLSLHTEPEPGS